VAAEAKRPHPAHSPAGESPSPNAVVVIQAGASAKSPLFCIHAEAGDVSLYYGLARHLPSDQPLFGLCAPTAAELDADASMRRIAELHVQRIRAAQESGPYLILGECTGGALAYEIAQQITDAGEQVALLALIDAFAPGLPRLHRYMPRVLYRVAHRLRILGFHLQNLMRLSVRDKLTYVVAKLGRARLAAAGKASALRGRSAATSSPRVSFKRALAGYAPKPYAGSLVLIRASSLPIGIEPAPDMGWAELSRHLQIETVPGYFTTPISEPGVQILSQRLSQHLASAPAR
jgi:thioesterase domain-containing protein